MSLDQDVIFDWNMIEKSTDDFIKKEKEESLWVAIKTRGITSFSLEATKQMGLLTNKWIRPLYYEDKDHNKFIILESFEHNVEAYYMNLASITSKKVAIVCLQRFLKKCGLKEITYHKKYRLELVKTTAGLKWVADLRNTLKVIFKPKRVKNPVPARIRFLEQSVLENQE
jgi:hypothetical protein